MALDNWADLAKQYYLYEGRSGGGVELMLQRTKTNSRVNEAMARWVIAVRNLAKCWQGPYKTLFDDTFEELQDHYLNMDAFSRRQAIELAVAIAKANATPAGPVEQEKKHGLRGLIGL